jgi:ATP-dependent DNA helicase RecG
MITMTVDLVQLTATLRTLGTDTSGVEAKRAAGGMPETAVATMCAFANRPGGGILLLGVDEAAGFRGVKVDAPRLSRQLADLSRQYLDPPPAIEIEIANLDGHDVVVASIAETATGAKPCRVRTGHLQGVWIRAFDGDYKASPVDEQALYATRVAPNHDRLAIEAASVSDLDSGQVESYLRARRASAAQSSRLRSMSDDELLHASSVLLDGHPTTAALLALGVFPQQFLPGVHVRAVQRSSDPALRALDAPRIEGSVPEMIEATVDWVARRSGMAIRGTGAGRVVNEPEWPADAVRELIGNALLHRDLSWSVNEPVLVTLRPGELIVRNPGGLYGITVGELGTRGITPARNATLMSIAAHVTLPGGDRTVEQLATGIPTILQLFEQRHYQRPLFVDEAVRFTVIGRSSLPSPSSYSGAVGALLDELGASIATVDELAAKLGRSEQVIRRDLRELIAADVVRTEGRRGRQILYRRTST